MDLAKLYASIVKPNFYAESASMSAIKRIEVGSRRLPNAVVLAPMSGVTDAPSRRLAESLGAGLVVSEMGATSKLAHGRRDAVLRADAAGAPAAGPFHAPSGARIVPGGLQIEERQVLERLKERRAADHRLGSQRRESAVPHQTALTTPRRTRAPL